MEKTLLYQDKNVKKYLVKFYKEEIEKMENRIAQYINNNYTFEGFRKGKVPREIIKLRLGSEFQEMLLEEAEHELEHKLSEEEKILFPVIIESSSIEDDVIEFEVILHTYPKISKTNFEDMVVKVPNSKDIVEEYINQRLNELLESNVILEPKNGPIEYGDFVRFLYSVVDSEDTIIEEEMEYEVVVREEDPRPLTKALIGKFNGEEFELLIEAEETEDGEELIQKIKIVQIYSRKIPELNDNFVKELNIEVETLSELKEKIRKEGEEAVQEWEEQFIINYILSELPNYVEIEISPETLNYYVERTINDLKRRGTYENELEKFNNDEEKFREDIEKSALKWIKEIITIEHIADENNIIVTEEELNQAIKNFGNMYGLPYGRALEIVNSNPQIFEELVWNELRIKVAKFIKEKVKIEEFESTNKEEEKEKAQENEENSDTTNYNDNSNIEENQVQENHESKEI
ncbi:MAG TPA: trigger factor [Defluviitoga sp.]|nr:trigger factor [Defluviitoga sp.]HOP24009.1 trigger factor [Defluviitoga sp.]HPZ28992.1 trigger factor [Defluviitoga sp.]HQD62330.1 trigger factor [Defluviitoga sp.]